MKAIAAIWVGSILAGCSASNVVGPQPPTAGALPERQTLPRSNGHTHHLTLRYRLVIIGTLGGPQSFGDPGNGAAYNIGNDGATSGVADTSSANPFYPNFNPLMTIFSNPYLFHAFTWKNGTVTDLRALSGPNSSVSSWITPNGMVCGSSWTGSVDPLTGFVEGHAVLWDAGHIVDLGTLGGYESGAGSCNSKGQATGFAANAIADPLSFLGLGTQTRAFVWQNGAMQDIGTLGGPDAFSPYINARGEIAGLSYLSSVVGPTGLPPTDPFVWDRGGMTDLGTLGGTFGGPGRINSGGQVVGSSDLTGDSASHPFLWDHGVMKDLGTLGGSFGGANDITESGDVIGGTSLYGDQAFHGFFWSHGRLHDLGNSPDGLDSNNAFSINAKGQIVGQSFTLATDSPGHALLWVDGEVIDLNVFVPPSAGITLQDSENINDSGEIFGLGMLSNREERAFVLVPAGPLDKTARSAQTQTAQKSVMQPHGRHNHSWRFWHRLLSPALHLNRLP
jgi:probable HAF family extracellular repeat protein